MREPLIKKKNSLNIKTDIITFFFSFRCCLKIDYFSGRKEVDIFSGEGISETLKPFRD